MAKGGSLTRSPFHSTDSRRSSPRCGVVAQVALHRRVLVRGRHEGVGQRVQRRHPGRDRGGEGLAEERAERLVLPGLDVPGGPVVDQHHAEDVVGEVVDRDPVAHACSAPRPRSPPRPRCPGVRRRRWSGPARWPAARTGGRPGCRRPPPCRPGRGSRSAGASSSAAAAAGPGGRSARRWPRGARRSRSRRSRRPRSAAAAPPRAAAPAAAPPPAGAPVSVSSSVTRCRTAVHCGRPSAMKSLSVGRPSAPAASTSPAASAPARSSTKFPIRTPIRGSLPGRPEHPVRQVGHPVRRTVGARHPAHAVESPVHQPQPDQIGQWFLDAARAEPDPERALRVAVGPGLLDQPDRVGGGEQLGHRVHLGTLGGGERGGQHVDEAVVGEAGLRVAVPHRVVQPGGQLERQLPVPAGADHRGQLDRGREELGGQPAGAELRRDRQARRPGPRRPRPARPSARRSAGSRRSTADAGQPLGELDQLGQAGLRVLAALRDRPPRPAGR